MEPKTGGSNRPTLGVLLREARNERRLSIDEVAESLRLSPRVISALEEEDYHALPGPTYVRGYLRSYAHFLGLEPQPLIEAFNARPEAARRTEMSSPAPVRQITSSDAMVRLGTTAVVVMVLGLAVLWWAGQDDSGIDAPVALTEPATLEPPPAAEPEPEPEPEPETTVAVPAGAPPAPEAPVEQPRPATPVELPPATAATAAVPAPDPGVPLSRVVLYVHDDSWADVRDARDRRLLYETVPGGRVVTVEGVAPISVFLGNVEGVTVEFNGLRYDALRHKRGQVARFTLGSPRG